MLAGELCHHLLRRFVEAHDDLHHADGLGQGAHEVVLREAVLLQEILPKGLLEGKQKSFRSRLSDDLRHLEGAFLVFRQGVLAHQPR